MSPVPLPGVGRLGAYCPVGCGGTLLVQFLDRPPRLRLTSCSNGCTDREIYEALK